MASKEVQLVTCDLCGFEKVIDITEYSLPPGWLWVNNVGDLCPECTRKFRIIATDFFEDKVPQEWNSNVFRPI